MERKEAMDNIKKIDELGISLRERGELVNSCREIHDFFACDEFEGEGYMDHLFSKEIVTPDNSWYSKFFHSLKKSLKMKLNSFSVPLSVEDERILFLRYNFCKYKISRIFSILNNSNYVKIIEWYRKMKEIENAIVSHNLALTVHLVNKNIRNKRSEVDELVSDAQIILIETMKKFNPFKGYKFSTFLTISIQNIFGKTSKRNSKRNSIVSMSIDEEEFRKDHFNGLGVDDSSDKREELLSEIKEAISNGLLTDKERTVIFERYFAMNRKTLDDLSVNLGVSRGTVANIENSAIDKLRGILSPNFGNAKKGIGEMVLDDYNISDESRDAINKERSIDMDSQVIQNKKQVIYFDAEGNEIFRMSRGKGLLPRSATVNAEGNFEVRGYRMEDGKPVVIGKGQQMYITVDAEGKEIKREIKSKGRNRAGYSLQSTGEFAGHWVGQEKVKAPAPIAATPVVEVAEAPIVVTEAAVA